MNPFEEALIKLMESFGVNIEDFSRCRHLIKCKRPGRDDRQPGDIIIQSGGTPETWNRLDINFSESSRDKNVELPHFFQIEKCSDNGKYLVITLKRAELFKFSVQKCLKLRPKSNEELPISKVKIEIAELKRIERSSPLSLLRCKLAADIVHNIKSNIKSESSPLSENNLSSSSPDKIMVTCANQPHGSPDIFCQIGPVSTDSQSRDRFSAISRVYEELFRQYRILAEERRNDSKGLDEKFWLNVHHSVLADIQFQLFSKTWHKPVRLIESTVNENASFVLYNYARLVNIFRAFNESYEMPEIGSVDWTLLKEQEEWDLVFCFLFKYQSVLEKSLGHFQVHTIFQFLVELTNLFSCYYKRVRILKDREHLVPTMNARIWLMKAVKSVYDDAFFLLNIHPNNNM